MDIARLNLNKINTGLSLLQEFVSEMKTLSEMSKEEFFSDRRNYAAAESYLRRSLECIFDIARHILAKMYGFKELQYKKIARELGERNVVDRDYSMTLIKMAGYRNRMVHLYHEVTPEEIYEILTRNLPDIERFIKEVSLFLERCQKNS